MAELRRTQVNVVKLKGILKAPSAAAIRQLTTDHNLGLSVDFSEGGKPENPEKNPRSTGETKFLRINAGLYPGSELNMDNWNDNCEAKSEAKCPRSLRGLQVDFSLTRNVSYAVR